MKTRRAETHPRYTRSDVSNSTKQTITPRTDFLSEGFERFDAEVIFVPGPKVNFRNEILMQYYNVLILNTTPPQSYASTGSLFT